MTELDKDIIRVVGYEPHGTNVIKIVMDLLLAHDRLETKLKCAALALDAIAENASIDSVERVIAREALATIDQEKLPKIPREPK